MAINISKDIIRNFNILKRNNKNGHIAAFKNNKNLYIIQQNIQNLNHDIEKIFNQHNKLIDIVNVKINELTAEKITYENEKNKTLKQDITYLQESLDKKITLQKKNYDDSIKIINTKNNIIESKIPNVNFTSYENIINYTNNRDNILSNLALHHENALNNYLSVISFYTNEKNKKIQSIKLQNEAKNRLFEHDQLIEIKKLDNLIEFSTNNLNKLKQRHEEQVLRIKQANTNQTITLNNLVNKETKENQQVISQIKRIHTAQLDSIDNYLAKLKEKNQNKIELLEQDYLKKIVSLDDAIEAIKQEKEIKINSIAKKYAKLEEKSDTETQKIEYKKLNLEYDKKLAKFDYEKNIVDEEFSFKTKIINNEFDFETIIQKNKQEIINQRFERDISNTHNNFLKKIQKIQLQTETRKIAIEKNLENLNINFEKEKYFITKDIQKYNHYKDQIINKIDYSINYINGESIFKQEFARINCLLNIEKNKQLRELNIKNYNSNVLKTNLAFNELRDLSVLERTYKLDLINTVSSSKNNYKYILSGKLKKNESFYSRKIDIQSKILEEKTNFDLISNKQSINTKLILLEKRLLALSFSLFENSINALNTSFQEILMILIKLESFYNYKSFQDFYIGICKFFINLKLKLLSGLKQDIDKCLSSRVDFEISDKIKKQIDTLEHEKQSYFQQNFLKREKLENINNDLLQQISVKKRNIQDIENSIPELYKIKRLEKKRQAIYKANTSIDNLKDEIKSLEENVTKNKSIILTIKEQESRAYASFQNKFADLANIERKQSKFYIYEQNKINSKIKMYSLKIQEDINPIMNYFSSYRSSTAISLISSYFSKSDLILNKGKQFANFHLKNIVKKTNEKIIQNNKTSIKNHSKCIKELNSKLVNLAREYKQNQVEIANKTKNHNDLLLSNINKLKEKYKQDVYNTKQNSLYLKLVVYYENIYQNDIIKDKIYTIDNNLVGAYNKSANSILKQKNMYNNKLALLDIISDYSLVTKKNLNDTQYIKKYKKQLLTLNISYKSNLNYSNQNNKTLINNYIKNINKNDQKFYKFETSINKNSSKISKKYNKENAEIAGYYSHQLKKYNKLKNKQ